MPALTIVDGQQMFRVVRPLTHILRGAIPLYLVEGLKDFNEYSTDERALLKKFSTSEIIGPDFRKIL